VPPSPDLFKNSPKGGGPGAEIAEIKVMNRAGRIAGRWPG